MHQPVRRLALLAVTACWTIQPAQAQRPPRSPSTYVFVHGAWGGSWDWRRVDSLLTRRGQRVYRPQLTGLGERVHLASPDIGLATHINDVVNTILWEDLHDVILVGHTYGGMVITGVADRAAARRWKVYQLEADHVPERSAPAALVALLERVQ